MGNLGFSRNDVALAMARHGGEEVTEISRTASTVAAHVCSILDEGQSLEIDVEVPGWIDRMTVVSPTQPGAVRGAVEKVLRDLGLPSV
jgi:hypothetical protein